MTTSTKCAIAQVRVRTLLLALATVENPEFEEKIKRDKLGRFATKVSEGSVDKEQVKTLLDKSLITDPELAKVMDFFIDHLDLSAMKEGLKSGVTADSEKQDKTINDGRAVVSKIKDTLASLNVVKGDGEGAIRPIVMKGMEINKEYSRSVSKLKNLEGETQAVQEIARMAAIAAEAGTAMALGASLSYVAGVLFGEATLATLLTNLNRAMIKNDAISTGQELLKGAGQLTEVDDKFYDFLGFCVGAAIGKAYRECANISSDQISPEMKANLESLATLMDKITAEVASMDGAINKNSMAQLTPESKKTVEKLGNAVKG